jgi:single-strand DNA-binding protein
VNKIWIVGNLTADPEKRSTRDSISVCSFTVAVNDRKKDSATFFRVTAWRGLADNCTAYLTKGRKVAVTGQVGISTYQGRDGKTHASIEVQADDVEFLTPRGEQPPLDQPEPKKDGGFVQVEDDDLPF